MDHLQRRQHCLLIDPAGKLSTTFRELSEDAWFQFNVCRSIEEASSVSLNHPYPIRYVLVDSRFFGTTELHAFVQKVSLATSDVVFLMFDRNSPESLTALFGHQNMGSKGVVAPKVYQESTPLIGKSKRLIDVLDLARRYARHDITVLVTGETGTGKELLARSIHDHSTRRDKSFVACNLASVPETLLESELFGYTKGAFTGANKDKKGFLEEAEGGTLFLDEVGDLPLTFQVKLLRLLENREYYKVGDPTPKTANVRIVAATNRDLARAIADGDFRKDLYYRLSSALVILPPLRGRTDDITLLAEHFIERACSRFQLPVKRVTSSIHVLLSNYSWPGNIRELKNVIESAVMVSNTDVLVMADLPMHLQQHAISNRNEISTRAIHKIEEAEKDLIEKALLDCNGNKAATAKSLGISTRTLYRRLEKLGVPVDYNFKTNAATL